MKILYLFAEEDSFIFKWQRFNIFDELSHHGIDIDVFNPLCNKSEKTDFETFRDSLFRNHEYDLFMTCHGDDTIDKRYLDCIKTYGIPSVLICFDNLHEPFLHKRIAKEFDLVWITSIETKNMFEKWGCKNIVFQPYAANPYAFESNIPIRTDNFRVCFIGTPYGSRVNKINYLTLNKIPVNLYTNQIGSDSSTRADTVCSWISNRRTLQRIIPYLSFEIGRKVLYSALKNKLMSTSHLLDINSYLHQLSSVSFEEMIRIYRKTALSLNISELRNTFVLKNPIHKLHLRTFEIPMAGGLELCSYTPEIVEYFKDGEEIVTYGNMEELVDKATFYTKPTNSSVVDKMKDAALNRAKKEHTWYNRFSLIFNKLELKLYD